MKSSPRFALAACLAVSLHITWIQSVLRAANDHDLALQQERQQQVQADTDSMVRRLGTMLRVLEYYQIDKAGERKMLEEMTGVLAGLSRHQMNEVIRRLDAASKAKDEATSHKEVQEAYGRHREILDTLKGLLARHDAVRSLDQAADLLDKLGKDQLELYLQTSQLIKDSLDESNPNLSPTQRLLLNKRRKSTIEPKRQGDAQKEIHRDVERVIQQVLDLRMALPMEQKDRVEHMGKLAAQHRLVENLNSASNKLKTNGSPAQKFDAWRDANSIQWQAAGQMNELARVLRASSERLAALREVRDRVDRALIKQDELSKETKDISPTHDPLLVPDHMAALAKIIQDARATIQIQELSKDQARVGYDTKDTASLVKPFVADVAKKIERAEQAMRDARKALVKSLPKEAAPAQDQAVKALRDARTDLDKLIATAEKQTNDPRTALQKAADDVDRLIKDQTDTRAKTKETADAARTAKLAKDQKGLASRAEQLKATPLPLKNDAPSPLDTAAKAMTRAAQALDKRKTDKALPKQEQAIKALEQVRKDIGEKIAELDKRQNDLAKLEDVAKKLGEPAQADIAQQRIAKALADINAKNIADQSALDPNKVDPEAAAQLIAKALEQTEKAEDRAKQAANVAGQDAQKGTDEHERPKAKPDLVRLQENIARQADNMSLPDAAKDAGKAAQALKQGAIDNAIENQQAALAKLHDASQKPLPPRQAKVGAPMPEQPKAGPMPGEAKSSEAKDGDPMAAQSKANQVQPGENKEHAKAGEQKAGDAKAGTVKLGQKPAEAKANQAKIAESKTAQPKGQPEEAQAKGAEGPLLPQAKNATELAQAQQEVMEATKALTQSQDANQAAMAALGQAQARAPQGVQKQLQDAGRQLAKANQNLQKGRPAQAGESQGLAAKELGDALKAMNAALAAMNQTPVQPGQPATAQAKANLPGQAGEEPMGDEGMGDGKEGQGTKPGQGKNKKPGPGVEKNEATGTGERLADGKTGNAKARLNDVSGDGSFLHLPPRQRELIRQALSGRLPPEYAAMIQQYYMNIARGKRP